MPDEKKLIIDEDWKSQVEAEKRQAQPEAKAAAERPSAEAEKHDVPMPPASLELLLTMLATEALMALGQVPNPITGRVETHRNQATYLIDTIDMLRQKTTGNLTSDEQLLIDTLLHQLRLAFVESAP